MTQCDCAGRTPTYPVFRDTQHLEDCPWHVVEVLVREVANLAEVTLKLANRITALENREQ